MQRQNIKQEYIGRNIDENFKTSKEVLTRPVTFKELEKLDNNFRASKDKLNSQDQLFKLTKKVCQKFKVFKQEYSVFTKVHECKFQLVSRNAMARMFRKVNESEDGAKDKYSDVVSKFSSVFGDWKQDNDLIGSIDVECKDFSKVVAKLFWQKQLTGVKMDNAFFVFEELKLKDAHKRLEDFDNQARGAIWDLLDEMKKLYECELLPRDVNEMEFVVSSISKKSPDSTSQDSMLNIQILGSLYQYMELVLKNDLESAISFQNFVNSNGNMSSEAIITFCMSRFSKSLDLCSGKQKLVLKFSNTRKNLTESTKTKLEQLQLHLYQIKQLEEIRNKLKLKFKPDKIELVLDLQKFKKFDENLKNSLQNMKNKLIKEFNKKSSTDVGYNNEEGFLYYLQPKSFKSPPKRVFLKFEFVETEFCRERGGGGSHEHNSDFFLLQNPEQMSESFKNGLLNRYGKDELLNLCVQKSGNEEVVDGIVKAEVRKKDMIKERDIDLVLNYVENLGIKADFLKELKLRVFLWDNEKLILSMHKSMSNSNVLKDFKMMEMLQSRGRFDEMMEMLQLRGRFDIYKRAERLNEMVEISKLTERFDEMMESLNKSGVNESDYDFYLKLRTAKGMMKRIYNSCMKELGFRLNKNGDSIDEFVISNKNNLSVEDSMEKISKLKYIFQKYNDSKWNRKLGGAPDKLLTSDGFEGFDRQEVDDSELDSDFDSELDSDFDSELDSDFDSELASEYESNFG
ncbi:MAG: hypothetical protein AAFO15_01115 [Pseudomonadota bacterium]